MGVEELMRILTQTRWVSNPLGMCWYVVQTLGEGTNFASQQVTPTSRILWNTLTFGGCAPSQDAIARWKSGSQPCSHPVMMFLHCWRDGAYLCLYWIKCSCSKTPESHDVSCYMRHISLESSTARGQLGTAPLKPLNWPASIRERRWRLRGTKNWEWMCEQTKWWYILSSTKFET